MISLIIDVIIALVCLIIIIRNAARGFIRSFMAFARTILAIFLAYIFNAPLAGLLNDRFFQGMATGWVNNAFLSTYDGESAYRLYDLFDGIPSWFANLLLRSGVDEATIQRYFYSGESAPIEVVEELSVSLGALLSSFITTVIAVVVIFVVVEILLAIIGAILNRAGKVPIIRFVNIILGAIIGAIFSAVIVLLIATALIWIINKGSSYNANIFATRLITDSMFLDFFNTNNVWQWIKGLVVGA